MAPIFASPLGAAKGIGFGPGIRALTSLGGQTASLGKVAGQEETCARSGFLQVGRTLRLVGRVLPRASVAHRIRPVGPQDRARNRILDTQTHGRARLQCLQGGLGASPVRRSFAILGPAGPTGFATVWRRRDGAKIGPFVSVDAEATTALIHACALDMGGGPMIRDLPEQRMALFGAHAAIGL